MADKKIEIYDTTLRDGSQGEGISFTVQDKLLIAKRIDDLGFHYIEGGWPGANPKDIAFFEAVREKKIKLKTIKGMQTGVIGTTPLKKLPKVSEEEPWNGKGYGEL